MEEFLTRADVKKRLKLSVSSIAKLHFKYLHPLRAKNKRIFYRVEEVNRVAFLLGKHENLQPNDAGEKHDKSAA